jgi:hypothetical protein
MATSFSAPALLVPVDVSAMVVTSYPRNFQRWPMNYGQLAYARTPEPAPFEHVDDRFSSSEENLGVYLAWTLPDALRRGAQNRDTGEMEFPRVPNRWLVVRVHGDPGSAPAAAWVVESDYVWRADPGPGGTSVRSARFLDPAPGLDAPRPVQIGRKVPLGAQGWTEPGHPAGWLTAVGPGNLSFSAFQPHNTNVFSLHDELGSLGVPDGRLSYFVAGWYSRPEEDDPLAQWDVTRGAEALGARLAELAWTASPGVLAEHLPRRTVYHGMAAAVRWEKEGVLTPGLPGPGEVRLAVGNTAVDAFAALVDDRAAAAGSPPGAAERLVEGALYDLLSVLDQPDGDVRLERALRDAWFGSRPGGSRWEIAAAEPRPGAPPAPLPPPAQLAAEAALLRPLNAAQAELDAALQRLASLQAELYELWWKSVRAPRVFQELDPGRYPAGTSPEQFAAALAAGGAESRPARVAAAMDEADRLSRERDLLKLEVLRALQAPETDSAREPGRVLKEAADARFWMAGDPVVILSGAKQDGTLRPRAVRACRTVDQLVAGLRIARTDGREAAVGADAAPVPGLPLGGTPPEVGPLLREFALLDPENAGALASALGLGPDEVQAVRAAILAPHPTAGLLPDHDVGEWRPPWLPLFLDWEVLWYPIPFLGNQAGPWRFDGLDHALTAAGDVAPQPEVINGRALLAPSTAASLRGRIQQLAGEREDAAGLRDLDALVTRETGWDLISQTLTGLHDQLALRDPAANLAPDGREAVDARGRTVAQLVGAGRHSVPLERQASGSGASLPVSTFEGVRAGQFVFSRLSVVDRFGQTVEVVTSELVPTFVPVRARGVVAAPSLPVYGTPVQLPPRLLQPARLAIDFLAPDDAPAWNAAGTPLCGWMVPNHLDRALSIHDAAGGILGELRTAAGPAGRPVAVWDPAPGTGAPATVDALRAAHPHLGDAVAGVAAAGADALARFLDGVDETLWGVDPLGERSDLLLNALVGRPLAVIRASVGVQLLGDPVSDPAWPFTFAPRRAPFTGHAWEVELGDAHDRRDGLIGYWAEGYGRFDTVHALPDAPPDGYLRQIGAGNRLLASVDGGPVRVTLLLDPRGIVSARCGLLPTREMVLPSSFVEEPLRAMQATFRSGPLLTVLRPSAPAAEASGSSAPAANTVPAAMPYPLPALRGGAWEWIELRDEGPPLVRPLISADGRAELLELPASLREGYLRLTSAPAEPLPGTPVLSGSVSRR